MKHIGHQVLSSVKAGLGDSKKKFVHLARLYDIWPDVMAGLGGDLPVLPSKIYVDAKSTPKTMKIKVSCPAALGPRLSLQKGVMLEKINFLMGGDPKAIDITFDHRL